MLYRHFVLIFMLLGAHSCFAGELSIKNDQKRVVIVSHFNLKVGKKSQQADEKYLYKGMVDRCKGDKNTITDLFLLQGKKRHYLGSLKGFGDYQILQPVHETFGVHDSSRETLFVLYKQQNNLWLSQARLVKHGRVNIFSYDAGTSIYNKNQAVLQDNGVLEKKIKLIKKQNLATSYSLFHNDFLNN